MFDYSKKLVSELKTLGLPVIHNSFLKPEQELPCISYSFMNDIQRDTAEYYGYSDMYFDIRVWAKSMEELKEITNKVDALMRDLGFKRQSVHEFWAQDIGQQILTYRGLGLYMEVRQ